MFFKFSAVTTEFVSRMQSKTILKNQDVKSILASTKTLLKEFKTKLMAENRTVSFSMENSAAYQHNLYHALSQKDTTKSLPPSRHLLSPILLVVQAFRGVWTGTTFNIYLKR